MLYGQRLKDFDRLATCQRGHRNLRCQMQPEQQTWRMNKELSLQTKLYCITCDQRPITHLRLKVVGPDLPNFPSRAHDLLENLIPSPRTKLSLLEDLQRNKKTTGTFYSLIFDENFDSDNWLEYGEGYETQKVGTWELTLLKAK